jgi:hypothetical protein
VSVRSTSTAGQGTCPTFTSTAWRIRVRRATSPVENRCGWRDNTPAALEAQLRWAHADGIGFFVFDWFNNPDPGNGPINMAHDNYLQLRNHDGVGFALAYIGNDGFGVPLDALPAVADRWVTEDFLNPDYVRIDGKPLLVVYEINDAAQLWGGAAGVNKGIEICESSPRRGRPCRARRPGSPVHRPARRRSTKACRSRLPQAPPRVRSWIPGADARTPTQPAASSSSVTPRRRRSSPPRASDAASRSTFPVGPKRTGR